MNVVGLWKIRTAAQFDAATMKLVDKNVEDILADESIDSSDKKMLYAKFLFTEDGWVKTLFPIPDDMPKEELDEIYRLYAGDVYRYLFSLCRNEHLAQDLLQDVMLKAVTGFDKFRGDSSVKTWLFTIAKNLYLNHVKRADNRNLPIEEEVLRSEDNLEERIMDQSQALHIHRLVHSLDDPYREVFTLRVFAELKFDDIGAVFGKTGNWARVSYYRAKEKILSMMKEDQI